MLFHDIERAQQGNNEAKWQKLLKFLPELAGIKDVYKKASVQGKQRLIRGVFKDDFSYFENKFRTPSIEIVFAPNALLAKEKGLLELEESFTLQDKIPHCSEIGI